MRKYGIICALAAALGLSAASSAFPAEPPTSPMLRIETGMHTAIIKGICTDAKNRWLVTGSDDKTVRVWDLPSGTLSRAIRPPADDRQDGRMYAVALSPDGAVVAAGGWTGYDWDGSMSIYLFDRATGRMIRRLGGLPSVITHLDFSPDGRYLAAALGEKNGIRVYKTASWTLADSDAYEADSYCVRFHQSAGRTLIASTCYDGSVRLYTVAGGLKLLGNERGRGGARLFSAAFSPDGARLAVGYNDTPKVDVFAVSGEGLTWSFSPDTSGAGNGNLASVAWSSDGEQLYAGGMYYSNGQCPIFVWRDGGRGSPVELSCGARNIIRNLAPLRDGGVLFGSADPAFGRVDRAGGAVLLGKPGMADFRSMDDGFRVSPDGVTVRFGYEYGGKSPAVFSLRERDLVLGKEPEGLKGPDTTSSQVADWENNLNPKLGGKPLSLGQYEMSRSLAVSPGGDGFLLGSEWHLRFFDSRGAERWKVTAPGIAWAVNAAGNGKLALAALGDGTIRWYRLSDGKELLSLFPHADRTRWVLWTPKGYYDASPGAEDLIGWHVNNGRDAAADFFPASRFRGTYYRPDVVAKVLETLDEDTALQLADGEAGKRAQQVSIQAALPPVVMILSPRDGAEFSQTGITITYSVRSSSGEPVTAVRALVDGRPVSAERGLVEVGRTETSRSMKITVPERDCRISIIAENKFAASEPAEVRIVWKGRAEAFVIKPKLYILSVGVSRYDRADLRLGFAAKDARDFTAVMRKQSGGLYREVAEKVLADAEATRDEVVDGLDWIQKQTTANDVAMIFLAGHGVNDQAGIYYFLPVNADTERLKRTCVPFSDFQNAVSSIAGKVVLFIDTCHSGNIMGTRRGAADINAVVNELSSTENGVVVFASSTGRQFSLEDPSWGNGAFTKALVEGVAGSADYSKTGRITVNMLNLYISERVKELTKGKQTPTVAMPSTVPDFPIAVK